MQGGGPVPATGTEGGSKSQPSSREGQCPSARGGKGEPRLSSISRLDAQACSVRLRKGVPGALAFLRRPWRRSKAEGRGGCQCQGRTSRTRTTCQLLGSQSVCEEPPNSLDQQLSYRWYLGGVRLASGQEPTPPPQPLACPRLSFFPSMNPICQRGLTHCAPHFYRFALKGLNASIMVRGDPRLPRV